MKGYKSTYKPGNSLPLTGWFWALKEEIHLALDVQWCLFGGTDPEKLTADAKSVFFWITYAPYTSVLLD